MASIRALCKTGVLLENGGVSFMGPVGETVDKYLSASAESQEFISTEDIFTIRNHEIQVSSVKVNGQPSAKCEVGFSNKVVDIEVDGTIEGHHFLDLEVTLRNPEGVLLARHAPGLYSGHSLEVHDGPFHLHNHIQYIYFLLF